MNIYITFAGFVCGYSSFELLLKSFVAVGFVAPIPLIIYFASKKKLSKKNGTKVKIALMILSLIFIEIVYLNSIQGDFFCPLIPFTF